MFLVLLVLSSARHEVGRDVANAPLDLVCMTVQANCDVRWPGVGIYQRLSGPLGFNETDAPAQIVSTGHSSRSALRAPFSDLFGASGRELLARLRSPTNGLPT